MVSSETKQESLSPRGILPEGLGGGKTESPGSALILSSEGPGSILGAKEDTAKNVHLSQGHIEGFPGGKDT